MNPLEHLKSVLCDPTGKCRISGSDEDRAIVDRALQALAEDVPETNFGNMAEQPAQQEYASFAEWAHDYVQDNLHKLKPAQQEPVAWLVVSKYSGGKRLDVEWNIDADAMAFALGRLPLYTTPPAQRKPLTDEQIDLFINGQGDEDDDDYVEPTGDGFGLTDADLVRLIRRVEAAHNIKENT